MQDDALALQVIAAAVGLPAPALAEGEVAAAVDASAVPAHADGLLLAGMVAFVAVLLAVRAAEQRKRAASAPR